MTKMFSRLTLSALLVCASLSIPALSTHALPDSAAAGGKTTLDSKVDSRIPALLEMNAQDRRAALRALDAKERKGLWFELKKAQFAAKNAVPKKSYRDPAPPLNVDWSGWNGLPEVVGTISYDSGFPTIGFGGGAIVGNRFNTHTGLPVLASGTVSVVQALVVPGPAKTTSSAGFVLLGPQTGGGGANAIFSSFGVASGVVDSVTFTGIAANYTGSSFFVLFGDFASVYIPVFGTGSTLGQGHHGVVGYTGGIGPNITGTFNFGGAFNSYIRASGNIVPVELMKFEVG